MEFNPKLFFLTFLLVGSHGFSLNKVLEPFAHQLSEIVRNNEDTKATIGELLEGPLCDFINETILSLPPYLQVFGDPPLVYNLTAIGGLLLNNSALMSGQLTTSHIALANLDDIIPGDCRLITETSSSPLTAQLSFQLPIAVEAKYIVDGILNTDSGPVQLHGEGLYSVALDINVALLTAIKYSPIFLPMKMLDFTYTIDAPTASLSLEGLEGSQDFVEEIERLFEGHILHGLSNLDDNLHGDITLIIPPAVNQYVLNGITALDLINIIIGPTTTTTPAPQL